MTRCACARIRAPASPLVSAIKSRPVYRPLALDPSGARHLLLADRPGLPPDAVSGAAALGATGAEIWTLAADSRALAGPAVHAASDGLRVRRAFRSRVLMLERLAHRLAAERMGLRLYAIGTEDFLWDVRNLAAAHGMGAEEVHLTHHGSRRRRVICVHCRTVTNGVTTTIVTCGGCGAQLFVRDHFSRLLGGFQGVQVDAEAPGEVPAAEIAYP